MKQRKLGEFSVTPIGFGCMNVSHAYAPPINAAAAKTLLQEALSLGMNLFDTAALYGLGANETLVGDVFKGHRDEIVLTSKCGLTGMDGKREINGRPEAIRYTCEQSLQRLQTEVIDVYYLHRLDPNVPIEDSVGALGELVRQGKIRAIGLSEVSATSIARAHAEFPITVVQSEYSLWTRNPEIAVLDACKQRGIVFMGFSPLARGFLSGKLRDVSTLTEKDIRLAMPRFAPDNYAQNLRLLDGYSQIASRVGCTPAQLALAWMLAKDETHLPLPGTSSIAHLHENFGALDVSLDTATLTELDALINQETVVGHRYSVGIRKEIDTEDYV